MRRSYRSPVRLPVLPVDILAEVRPLDFAVRQKIAPQETRAGDALPIGAVLPTLGRYAVSGLQSLQGARLAVEDLNRAGGVRGRPLRLAEYRTGSYFVDARDAAARAARAGTLAIVGANSSELSQAVAEEAEANGIPQITNVSTAADLTWDPEAKRARPFVFRMCATGDVMGELLAGFARDELGAKRTAVLYEVGRTYSQRLARGFIGHFSDDVAGHVVAEFFYLALETDFRPQLGRIREFRPDVLFVPRSFPDATLVEITGNLLIKLYKTLEELKPDACVFLGDTNTVASCIAPALLNIPVVHIEGGMRSYDWRMPEEKYRTISDHLADKIYVYFEEYKQNLIHEGVNPNNVIVVGNPIVDIVQWFYFDQKERFQKLASAKFFKKHGVHKNNYLVMTCHRRVRMFMLTRHLTPLSGW